MEGYPILRLALQVARRGVVFSLGLEPVDGVAGVAMIEDAHELPEVDVRDTRSRRWRATRIPGRRTGFLASFTFAEKLK
jgi:hypothetical protein